jgi:hypothetical protein
LRHVIRTQVATLLSLKSIEDDSNFLEHGLNSMSALELMKNRPDHRASPLMFFVSVNAQVKLHVRHRPGVRSRAFLLVHGPTSNAGQWDEVADRLAAESHPVYAADLRGHSESDRPDDSHDTATAASDVAQPGRRGRPTPAAGTPHVDHPKPVGGAAGALVPGDQDPGDDAARPSSVEPPVATRPARVGREGG